MTQLHPPLRSLRIAFCGASGTGKSTLANVVSERFALPFCPVGARSVAQEMGLRTPYDADADPELRARFQKRLLASKEAWEVKHDSFVTDRTPLDNIAYSMLHNAKAIDEEGFATALRGFARYTHVFYCPMSAFWNVGNDEARKKERLYHELYECALEGLLARGMREAGVGFEVLHPKVRSVESSERENRENEVIDAIRKP